MNICAENKAVGLDVRNFLIHVPNVNEESITDYLVWKWEEINDAAKFRCLDVRKFTRQEEHNKTGADFELELWILSPQPPISLIFQAKKFFKENDGYVRKLRYPDDTQGQLQTLLKYADTNPERKPFYMIYSPADTQLKTMCANCNYKETGMFMIDAKIIEEFSNLPPHSRLSLTEILEKSLPFHCMFCCSMNLHEYFARFFSTENQTEQVFPSENPLPRYVKDMLSGELNIDNNNYELPPARWVAVYDTRFERED